MAVWTTPNVVEKFADFLPLLKNRQILVFSDYDGTLTPIVSNPENAVLPEQTACALLALERRVKCVGIVTGRSLKKITQFVDISPTIVFAASHGYRIKHGEKTFVHKGGADFSQILKNAIQEILPKIIGYPGVHIEDNEFTASLHYRNIVDRSQIKEVEAILDEVLQKYSNLKKCMGKEVFEIRIDANWDKGEAVHWLIHSLGFAPNDNSIAVIYLGDDVSDEVAFKAVKKYSNSISILVSETPNKESAALAHLDDVHQVQLFFHRLSSLP